MIYAGVNVNSADKVVSKSHLPTGGGEGGRGGGTIVVFCKGK